MVFFLLYVFKQTHLLEMTMDSFAPDKDGLLRFPDVSIIQQ